MLRSKIYTFNLLAWLQMAQCRHKLYVGIVFKSKLHHVSSGVIGERESASGRDPDFTIPKNESLANASGPCSGGVGSKLLADYVNIQNTILSSKGGHITIRVEVINGHIVLHKKMIKGHMFQKCKITKGHIIFSRVKKKSHEKKKKRKHSKKSVYNSSRILTST